MKEYLNKNENYYDGLVGKGVFLFEQMDTKILTIFKKSSEDFSGIHNIFKILSSEIRDITNQSIYGEKYEQNIQRIKAALNDIHSNLQFDDIINQRISHVQLIY